MKVAYSDAANNGPTEVGYNLHGVRFRADFRLLTRSNLASKRVMQLRLRDGELPFRIPGQRSAEASEADAISAARGIAPDSLVCAATGQPVPVDVRKAWGQGIPEEFTMTGAFEFILQLVDRERLGELLSWHIMSAGVDAQSLNMAALTFTDRWGNVAAQSKEVVQRMLEKESNFPVKIKYAPPKAFQSMTPQDMLHYETVRTHLLAVKNAVKELDGDITKVKHLHQKKTFERYLLYLEDHKYQSEDDLSDAMTVEELVRKYPHLGGVFGLTYKVCGDLPRVLRGEVDILEYLFGG